ITNDKKEEITKLIEKYGITDGEQYSALRRNSMACVAFPTCGLAMAEAERYLPSLLGKIEEIIDESGLRDKEIVIRMSGCPNSCSRPALGEIGFIGKAPGKYIVCVGASVVGDRLNKLYKENIGEEEILNLLRPLIFQYAKERNENEHFGDFMIRAGHVKAVQSVLDFHD